MDTLILFLFAAFGLYIVACMAIFWYMGVILEKVKIKKKERNRE